MNHFSFQDIDTMRNTDIQSVDKTSLIDLDSVHIDSTQPVQERIQSFLQQIQNPYCFRIGNVAIKVNYKSNGPSFQQNYEDALRTAHE